MRIDRLVVSNFCRYQQQEFNFRPQFNLIVGENGAGKTTLLNAVAIAAGSWFLGMRGYDSRSIWPDEARVVRRELEGVPTFEHQYPVRVSAWGEVQGRTIEWSRVLEGEGGRTTRVRAGKMKSAAEHAHIGVLIGDPVILPVIAHYGAGRLWVSPKDMRGGDKPAASQPSRLEGYHFSLDPRINFPDLFRWLRKEKYVALEQGSEREQFRVVKAAMLGCLEGGQWLDYSVKEQALIVEVKDRGQLPFHLLSDGQRNMLALAADIAFKAAQLNPGLGAQVLEQTSGVVLIDELDLHLHPRWQRHVVADLKRTFPQMQFFGTTHSPQIVGETPREEVIILRENGVGHPSVAYGADSNWILEFVMGAQTRAPEIKAIITAADDALERGELETAREKLAELRHALAGDDGEVARIESSIETLEALARAEN
jgi:predicted ATP-binding protein involved in virulence